MIIIEGPIPSQDLARMAQTGFGNLIKAVVDVEQRIMAVDGELHADEEALLLEQVPDKPTSGGSRSTPTSPRAIASNSTP